MSFLSSLFRILLYPLSFSVGVINRVLLYFATWLPTSRRYLANDPASVADRWVRELEEETGAIRESRLGDVVGASGVMHESKVVGVSSSTETQAGPGPSTLSRRNENYKAYRQLIPEFYLGSYEDALDEAQREAKLMCVILVSEEHDDVAEFKRTTLVDPDFNQLLKRNQFIVWGGDVRDYEASQASQKLGATTYPFVAFVGLQPRSSGPLGIPRSSSASPVLTVLSRHQGLSTPSGPDLSTESLGPTSPFALCNHLTNSLLPRIKPFLDRLRSAREEQLSQRRLREEQDAAFALSAQRDRERIEAKKAEEQKKIEEIEMQERKRSEEEAAKQKLFEEKQAKEANRLHWYRYARSSLLLPEPGKSKEVIRIGVRLPDGRLQVRFFNPSDTLTSLYVFAASQLIPKELPLSEDPRSPPSGFLPGEAGVTDDSWSFKLALAYPRQEVPWAFQTPLSTLEGLKGGAQLVVESLPGHTLIPGSSQTVHEDSDGYDTEEE